MLAQWETLIQKCLNGQIDLPAKFGEANSMGTSYSILLLLLLHTVKIEQVEPSLPLTISKDRSITENDSEKVE